MQKYKAFLKWAQGNPWEVQIRIAECFDCNECCGRRPWCINMQPSHLLEWTADSQSFHPDERQSASRKFKICLPLCKRGTCSGTGELGILCKRHSIHEINNNPFTKRAFTITSNRWTETGRWRQFLWDRGDWCKTFNERSQATSRELLLAVHW